MPASVSIEITKMDDLLKGYMAMTGKGLEQITRAHARLCAVELANRTQPFTSGPSSGPARLKQATFYLEKQIRRPVRLREDVEDRLQKIEDESIRQRVLNLFNAGRYDVLKVILHRLKIIKSEEDFRILSGKEQIKKTHVERRSTRTGQTYSRRGEINMSKAGIQGYVNEVAKRIGYAKSGWSECARKIGGMSGDGARGIPAFAKRQRSNHFSVETSGSDLNPSFTMTNTTPWIRRLLGSRDELDAQRIAREKMVKAMQRTIKEARKGQAAAREAIAREVAEAA